MSFYGRAFEMLGLQDWCREGATGGMTSLADLRSQVSGVQTEGEAFPFPSLDALHDACPKIAQSRDFTSGVEDVFIDIRGALKFVLDPITQPLSWMLDSSMQLFTAMPWWILMPLLIGLAWYVARSVRVVVFVAVALLFLAFIDHFDAAIQTLSIVFVCTILSVVLGVPIGIMMSKSNTLQRMALPVLDLLQTLPSFVYLIPLIYLFSVTESKLYGIAIILYSIVPIIRLTDLGIRLVDRNVIEAADAYGLSGRQKLTGVELPLALPTIMAGVNQTIMMCLAMVVIASLVSAPGLGVLVLRGIRNLELGVGMIAGLGIVLLAIILDRTSKAALERINTAQAK